MIQENFIGKGDMQHKLKDWKPQPEPERKIELCTPDIVDLPIIDL
jgi:hypothetical protein